MKIATAAAFSLVATTATAHAGHGKGWFHKHQDELIDAAMIAFACLIAVYVVRLMWKVVAK